MAIIHSLRKGWLPVFDMLADAKNKTPALRPGFCLYGAEGGT